MLFEFVLEGKEILLYPLWCFYRRVQFLFFYLAIYNLFPAERCKFIPNCIRRVQIHIKYNTTAVICDVTQTFNWQIKARTLLCLKTMLVAAIRRWFYFCTFVLSTTPRCVILAKKLHYREIINVNLRKLQNIVGQVYIFTWGVHVLRYPNFFFSGNGSR